MINAPRLLAAALMAICLAAIHYETKTKRAERIGEKAKDL